MYKDFLKRVIDVVFSVCALIILSPLILLLTIFGSIFMGGNPFFFQYRPEIFNILKGDMSIIGPRPLLPRDVEHMSKEQHRRHNVRPGLTGLAQCSGRNSLNWDEKLRIDIEYVDNISFLTDCKIFCKTIIKVLKRENIAFEEGTDMDLKDWNELKNKNKIRG